MARWSGLAGCSPVASPGTATCFVSSRETLPTTIAAASMASSFASRQRARGRIDPKIDGRAGAAAFMAPSRPGSPPRRVAARPLEAETDLADLDDVAEADRGDALDRRAVEERAVSD